MDAIGLSWPLPQSERSGLFLASPLGDKTIFNHSKAFDIKMQQKPSLQKSNFVLMALVRQLP
jgi:hypothetical protein